MECGSHAAALVLPEPCSGSGINKHDLFNSKAQAWLAHSKSPQTGKAQDTVLRYPLPRAAVFKRRARCVVVVKQLLLFFVSLRLLRGG
jgi:hypothetical protein